MTEKISYRPRGVCARRIDLTINTDTGEILEAEFLGGCDGNTHGLSRLLVGMKIDDVIGRLEGIRCGSKSTSCPDQLAQALQEYKNSKKITQDSTICK